MTSVMSGGESRPQSEGAQTLIPFLEAMRTLDKWRGEAVVVSTTTALRQWSSVSSRRELDLDLSDCMDKASSVGLGIALAQHRRKVLVLDCHNVLRKNIGSLITMGNAAPKNLVHFLFVDGSYIHMDSRPIPGFDGINYTALTEDGGYARSYQFEDLEEFTISLQEVLEASGPTFVSLKVVHDTPIPDYPSRSMRESLRTVKDSLAMQGSASTKV